MKLHLIFLEKFDVFYFNQNQGNEQIEFNFPVNTIELLNYLQASLSQMKCVFIVKDKNEIPNLKIDECRSKHCLINRDKYLFLNVSIRNHLKKLSNKNFTIESYHQVEDFFENHIQKLI